MKVSLWTDKQLMKGAEPVFLKGVKKTGVLLLHGWSSSPQELNPSYVPSAAKYLNSLGYTIYVPLRLGHGTEPEDIRGLGWEDWLEDARRHFKLFSKEVEKVVIGGMSMGAQLALQIAKESPVAGVIAMGTPIFMSMDPLFRLWAWLNRKNNRMLAKRYMRKDRETAMRKVHYIRYPARQLYENAKVSWKIRKILKEVTAPILVMHSPVDNVVDPMSAKYLMKRIGSKQKKLFWVKDSYHSFTTDKNAGLANKAMGDFLGQIEKG